MDLEPIVDGVWGVHTSVRLFAGAVLPLRMTVVRTGAGLALYSPVRPEGGWVEALPEPVTAVVSPNALHHFHFRAAAARFPEARRIGSKRLKTKRPELDMEVFEVGDDVHLGDDVQVAWIDGVPDLSEMVWFHVPTKTLIVADVIFNVHETRGPLTPWLLRGVGAYRKPGQSRLLKSFVKDRKAFGRSLERILDWPIERVVPCHGRVLNERAQEGLRWAFGWGMSA